ncbi:MAG: hypothetical protein LLG00_11590 [Planctomycetaceae bacterium]|nr:hypothetical protein [Planctomycetaceae bacterium]
MNRRPEPQINSTGDCIKAFGFFSDALRTNRGEVEKCFSSHGRRFDFARLSRATTYRKVKLGGRLLAEYRRNTGEVGAIDWKRFQAWCLDHWKLVVGVKVVLTLLFLFCL